MREEREHEQWRRRTKRLLASRLDEASRRLTAFLANLSISSTLAASATSTDGAAAKEGGTTHDKRNNASEYGRNAGGGKRHSKRQLQGASSSRQPKMRERGGVHKCLSAPVAFGSYHVCDAFVCASRTFTPPPRPPPAA